MGMRFSALHKLLSLFETRPKWGWSNPSWGPDGDTAISFLRLRIGCEWSHPQLTLIGVQWLFVKWVGFHCLGPLQKGVACHPFSQFVICW